MPADVVPAADLARLWGGGVLVVDIAAMFDTTPAGVVRQRQRQGLPARGRGRVPFDAAAFARLWLAGEPVKTIAERFGGSSAWVIRVRASLGLPRRYRRGNLT